jgi:hypothetical protein
MHPRAVLTRRALVVACAATAVAAEESRRAYAAPRLIEIGQTATTHLGHSGATTRNQPSTGSSQTGGSGQGGSQTGGGQGGLSGSGQGGGQVWTGTKATNGWASAADPSSPVISVTGAAPMVVSALPATGAGTAAHD